ncbi:MAG: NTP transferase domain-containing protein [Anaerolineales bacterium]|nr:NTP transferase domain-containing protein [Anaerolineales bacterium]
MERALNLLVSVAILAGGQSKRMGRDKAFLEVGAGPSSSESSGRCKR